MSKSSAGIRFLVVIQSTPNVSAFKQRLLGFIPTRKLIRFPLFWLFYLFFKELGSLLTRNVLISKRGQINDAVTLVHMVACCSVSTCSTLERRKEEFKRIERRKRGRRKKREASHLSAFHSPHHLYIPRRLWIRVSHPPSRPALGSRGTSIPSCLKFYFALSTVCEIAKDWQPTSSCFECCCRRLDIRLRPKGARTEVRSLHFFFAQLRSNSPQRPIYIIR